MAMGMHLRLGVLREIQQGLCSYRVLVFDLHESPINNSWSPWEYSTQHKLRTKNYRYSTHRELRRKEH